MNERDLQDNTYIPTEENEMNFTNDPNSGNYSVSVNTNMRQSLPMMNQTNSDNHEIELFNQWAKSLN